MDIFACLLCDWIGTPKPILVPKGGGGGLEFLSLQPGAVKPLLYTLELVIDGTNLVRLGNFATEHVAGGWAIWFHINEACHCRVRPVRDFCAVDPTDPDLFAGFADRFVPAAPSA